QIDHATVQPAQSRTCEDLASTSVTVVAMLRRRAQPEKIARMDQIVHKSFGVAMCFETASRTPAGSDCIRDCMAEAGISLAFHRRLSALRDSDGERRCTAQSAPALVGPPRRTFVSL